MRLMIVMLAIYAILLFGGIFATKGSTRDANLDAINKALNICHFEDDSFGTCYPDNPKNS